MIVTVKELSATNGVAYSAAHGFVTFLVNKGYAKVQSKKQTKKRGQPAHIYEISDKIVKLFSLEDH